MGKARRAEPGPLSFNQVLVEELRCLRSQFVATDRPEKPDLSKLSRQTDPLADRTRNLRALYKWVGCMSTREDGSAGDAPLSALCISGGGIRSATFNLGVLQVLARIGLLGRFDYLSSVSGGGYIAAWLRAWMHRRKVDDVVDELGGREPPEDAVSKEPDPVTKLREFSNYLTPRLGLFSGDTWAVIAIVCRNLLLNWLVLLPLLGCIVGIPLLFVTYIRTQHLPESLPGALIWVALGFETLASLLIFFSRRFKKEPDTSQTYFVLACVLPVCLAGAALSTAGFGLRLPWKWPDAAPTSCDFWGLWGFAVLWSIGVPVLGWALAELAAKFVPCAQKMTTGKNARQVSAWLEFGGLLASGAVGAGLFAGSIQWWFHDVFYHPLLYVVVVFPALLGIYLLSRTIFIAITSFADERGDDSGTNTARGRISSNDSDREWWARLSGWVLLVMVSWTVTTGICLLGCYLPQVVSDVFRVAQENETAVSRVVKAVVAVIGAISGAVAALTGSSSKTPHASEDENKATPFGVKAILAVTGPLFVACLIMLISWGVKALAEQIIGPPGTFDISFNLPGSKQPVSIGTTEEFLGLLVGLLAVSLVMSRFTSVNRFSLHGMYRNRLVRAYLGASNGKIGGKEQREPDPFTGFALDDNFALYKLCTNAQTAPVVGGIPQPAQHRSSVTPPCVPPLSIFNTTLNLVAGEDLAWQQRKAESFSMTPLFCGNWKAGYRRSREYGGPGGITVGTAMAISGAAANPSMGYSSSPVLSFLMAIFNVRLGAWLGNTNKKGDKTFYRPGPPFSILPLIAEMLGLTSARRGYVNLSDGGHFDNLGLYEAVLRRCRHVLISDAGQDGAFSFEDLGNAIRKVRIDFGINIVFDKIEILPNTPEKEGLYCAVGKILYSEIDGTQEKDDGKIIYIKPTLRGRGAQFPYDIYSYSRESANFPHESTADQWFTESQFESYRALGAHVVEQLVSGISQQDDAHFEDFYASAVKYVRKTTCERWRLRPSRGKG